MAKRKVSAATRKKLSRAAKNRKRTASGAFAKRGGGSKKRKRNPAPKKRRAPTKARGRGKAPAKRRANPRRAARNFTDTVIEGAIGSVTLTASKVAVRSTPQLLGFARAGNKGLATQVASAVLLGFAADWVMGPGWAAWVLAGGLQGPLEDGAARYSIPVVSSALAPAGTVSRYGPRAQLARYGARRMPPTARRRAIPATAGSSNMGSWVTSPPASGINIAARTVM